MKKISLKILMVLTLALPGATGYAAASASSATAETETGPITKSAFKESVLKAIDIVYSVNEEARSKIKQERQAFQGNDRAIKVVGEYDGTQYIIWGSRQDEPMDPESCSFPEEVSSSLSEELDGEALKYIHVERYEEMLPSPSRALKVSPEVFEKVSTEYPFVHFKKDINVLSDRDKSFTEGALNIPERTAVIGAFPDEGFIATGASLVRILNTENSVLGVMNDCLDGSTLESFNKLLKKVQGDSLPEHVAILIEAQRICVDEIALGHTLVELGYLRTRVSAFPGIFGSLVRYFASEEAKSVLINPVLEEWNAMEAGEFPVGEKYYAQTCIISPDGSVRTFLNQNEDYLSMVVPKLPVEDGRDWFISSTPPFGVSHPEEGDGEAGASASSASATSAEHDA